MVQSAVLGIRSWVHGTEQEAGVKDECAAANLTEAERSLNEIQLSGEVQLQTLTTYHQPGSNPVGMDCLRRIDQILELAKVRVHIATVRGVSTTPKIEIA